VTPEPKQLPTPVIEELTRCNLVTEENGDLLADSHILNWWKNHFSITATSRQNVQFSDVKAEGAYSYHCTLNSKLSGFEINYTT
jgi:hypothetical protein